MKAPSERTQKLIENLTDEDWHALYKRLWLFAIKKCRTSGAIDADDLVQDAIESLLSGERFKPDNVNLKVFLLMSIKSNFSHIRERREREVGMEDEPGFDPSFSPLVPREFHEAFDLSALHDRIRDLVRDDETLRRIVEVWFLDPDLRPRDIAERLQVPISDIQNAQKRLRKRLEKLWSKV